METAAVQAFDDATFREVLGHFPTGVVLVTALAADGAPVGMVLGSFTSVSMDPPMVGFLPTRTSSTYTRLRTADHFCVNVLASDQTELCRRFAQKTDQDKFAGLSWTPSSSGAPVLDGVVASIECAVESEIEAGDHYLVLGRVEDLGVHRPTMPLLFFQGGYGRFTTHAQFAESDADFIEAARLAEIARPDVEWLADTLGVECTIMTRSGEDVVVLARAAGPDIAARTDLGARTPLMPPLGEAFIAFAEEADVNAWLARRSKVDSVEPEEYRARLDLTRARGWSMALCGPVREREFADAVKSTAHGEPLPSQRRELATVVSQVSADHAIVDLVDGRTYDVSGIAAPVLDSAGRVRFVLRLTQLPKAASARDVTAWTDVLLQTTARIGETISERCLGL